MDDQSTPDSGAGSEDPLVAGEQTSADTPTPKADPDATAPMERSSDGVGTGDNPDPTEVLTPSSQTRDGEADPDATSVVDPDATRLTPPVTDDAAAVAPGSTPTAVLRPQTPNSTSVLPVETAPARWSGKANVPAGPPRDLDATAQWAPPEPGRAWWLPILLAVIGLILLVGIVYALVTKLDNGSSNVPAPSKPTVTGTPSQTPSTAPSTPSSSAEPTTPTATSTFAVPSSLIGLPIADAESILDSYGITYTAVPEPNDSELPNTVLSTSPGPGEPLPDGSSITLYYAQPSGASQSATPTMPGPSAVSPSPSPSQ